jgi:hypothetical protein
LYLLVILGWTFTTMPDRYFLTIPLLILLHMLAGAASAGASLSTGTIGYKLAPDGRGTSYMSATSVISNTGAAIGPLIGGALADFFSVRVLSFQVSWTAPGHLFELSTLNMTGFDFLFGITFIVGLFSLRLLARVQETGAADTDEVMAALTGGASNPTSAGSSVPGFGLTSEFSTGLMRLVPGLDVAVGATAYQISEATRAAVSIGQRGRSAQHQVQSVVVDLFPGRVRRGETTLDDQNVRELAQEAARGAVLAVQDSGIDAEEATAALRCCPWSDRSRAGTNGGSRPISSERLRNGSESRDRPAGSHRRSGARRNRGRQCVAT